MHVEGKQFFSMERTVTILRGGSLKLSFLKKDIYLLEYTDIWNVQIVKKVKSTKGFSNELWKKTPLHQWCFTDKFFIFPFCCCCCFAIKHPQMDPGILFCQEIVSIHKIISNSSKWNLKLFTEKLLCVRFRWTLGIQTRKLRPFPKLNLVGKRGMSTIILMQCDVSHKSVQLREIETAYRRKRHLGKIIKRNKGSFGLWRMSRDFPRWPGKNGDERHPCQWEQREQREGWRCENTCWSPSKAGK